MPLVRTQQLVDAARRAGTAVMAFNVITVEYAEAIAAAAAAAGRPAILQISHNAVRYHGGVRPIAAAAAAVALDADADLALHLDHVEDLDLFTQAADAGFSSAMFDAGALPYDANVQATATAAAWAQRNGIWIEAELGHVGGKPGAPASAHAPGVRTDPAEARNFVERTGVDALAVAVGSAHAMTSRTARLDQNLIAAIARSVPVPLVLHGSSGVPDHEIQSAVTAGIVKINIGTALNLVFTSAVRESLAATSASDPRRYVSSGRDAVARVVQDLLGLLRPPAPLLPSG